MNTKPNEELEKILVHVALNGSYTDAGQRVLSREVILHGISNINDLIQTEITEAERRAREDELKRILDYVGQYSSTDSYIGLSDRIEELKPETPQERKRKLSDHWDDL